MTGELLVRFLIGGGVVAAFATIAEGLKPKTFAGLFGAAPSVAIASLALSFAEKGPAYVATQMSGMMVGALALTVYGCLCVFATKRSQIAVWLGAALGWLAWLAVALTIWWLLGGTKAT